MTTTAENNSSTRSFEAEVKQVLDLVIHSLYSNKEIFLRELISNSSDALDKLRFLALSNKDLIAENEELAVKLFLDEEKRRLIIRDNGIGMNEEDLINNLGTIAKSGTKEFLKLIKDVGWLRTSKATDEELEEKTNEAGFLGQDQTSQSPT